LSRRQLRYLLAPPGPLGQPVNERPYHAFSREPMRFVSGGDLDGDAINDLLLFSQRLEAGPKDNWSWDEPRLHIFYGKRAEATTTLH
jgi:hypothetical protein